MNRPPFAKALRPNYGVLVTILSIACCHCQVGVLGATTMIGLEQTVPDNSSVTEPLKLTTEEVQVTTIPCLDPNCASCSVSVSSCKDCKIGYYLRKHEVTTAMPAVAITTMKITNRTVVTTDVAQEPLNTTPDTSPGGETTKQAVTYTCAQCNETIPHCKKCTNETHCSVCMEPYEVESGNCLGPMTTYATPKPDDGIIAWLKKKKYLVAGGGGCILLIALICICVCCIRRRRQAQRPGPPPDLKALGMSSDKRDGVKKQNTYRIPDQRPPREDTEEEEEEEEVRPIAQTSPVNKRMPARPPAADPPASPPPNGNVVVDLPSSTPPFDFTQLSVPVPPLTVDPSQDPPPPTQSARTAESNTSPLYGNVNGINMCADEHDEDDYQNWNRTQSGCVDVHKSTSHLPTSVPDVSLREATSLPPRAISEGSENYYNAGPESYYNVYPGK